LDRAFYRAALFYAKARNAIVNNRIVVDLEKIVERLRSSIRNKIMSVGAERVKEMLVRFEEKGVLGSVPQLKLWIKDARYVFWLGLNSQAPHNRWIT
jgi:hypothetical protein